MVYFYNSAALLAMQSAVLATAIPSVRLSVCPSVRLFSINGFLLFRKDRVKRKGGGVCVYVKESLNPMIISERCTLENSEILFLCIKHSGLSYFLCACYHPPRPKYNNTALINMLDINIESSLDVQDSLTLLYLLEI